MDGRFNRRNKIFRSDIFKVILANGSAVGGRKEIPFVLDAPDALDANDGAQGLCHTWLASGSSSASGCLGVYWGRVENVFLSPWSGKRAH
jgi:hypothetical protein